ncbi:hypothetical protein PO124_06835 [Bacillus licheniformis]|nr:hypothetical protein [Bacillus licheniformis]
MIGVVLPTISLPYFGELLEGIAEEAAKEGVHFSLYQTNYQLEKKFCIGAAETKTGGRPDFCSKRCPMKRFWTGVKPARSSCARTQASSTLQRSAFRIKKHSDLDWIFN